MSLGEASVVTETGSGSAAHAHVPLQRIGQPEDYAEAIVFLAAGASYVTGVTVAVDGGFMA